MKALPSRRDLISLIGILLCSTCLLGCTPKQQAISIATHTWPGYEPLSLARSMGWLDEQQVKLVETESFTDSIKLLEEGKIDAAGLTLDEVLRLREKGIPLSIVLVCDISAGADMLLARPGIKTLAELKGKRVAVEDGALGSLMLHQALLNANLQRNDVQVVSVSVDKQAAAWQRGEIEAAITFDPGSSQIIKQGGKLLFDSRQIPNLILDVIAVRTPILDDAHASAIRHMVLNHLKGLQHIGTHPDDAAYRMSSRFNLPPDQVMASFKGLVLPDLENNLRLLTGPSPIVLSSAHVIAEAITQAGILHKPADLTGLLRPEFLPTSAN